MTAIGIRYDGYNVTPDVVFADAEFESVANGEPGLCKFRVKDMRNNPDYNDPGFWVVGRSLELTVDGDVVWQGYATKISQQYAFAVVDTTYPAARERFWVIEGTDLNILFSRRFYFDQASPTSYPPNYNTGTTDTAILADLFAHFVDLSGDDIDVHSGVTHVGVPGVFEPFNAANMGDTWGTALATIAENLGAIWYIGPDRVFYWVDDETVTAPIALSDQPVSVSTFTDGQTICVDEEAMDPSITEDGQAGITGQAVIVHHPLFSDPVPVLKYADDNNDRFVIDPSEYTIDYETGLVTWADPDAIWSNRWNDVEQGWDYVAATYATYCYDPPAPPTVIGYRELEILSSATDMANDALVWGAGLGSQQVVFSRNEDAASIAEHGRFQWSDFRQDMYKQQSADRVSKAYVDGSPQNHRGHKNDHDFIKATTFYPGFRVGQVVDFQSVTFDYSDHVPIRRLRMSFPTTSDVMYELELSHELDVGLAFAEIPPFPTGPGTGPRQEIFSLDWPPQLYIPVGVLPSQTVVTQTGLQTDARRLVGIEQGVPFVNNDTIIQPFTDTGVLSAVGYNIAYTQLGFRCTYPDGSPVGFGGWGPGTDEVESWYGLNFTNVLATLQGRVVVLRLDNMTVSGHCPAIWVGISYKQGLPAPEDFQSWTPICFINNSSPDIDYVNDRRSADFGRLQLPSDLLHDGQNWIVIAPTWKCSPEFFCDIDYSEPGSPYAANGPATTGQGNSGLIIPSPRLGVDYVALPNQQLPSNRMPLSVDGIEIPFADVAAPGHYFTQFAYLPGSLEASMNGTPLRKGLEVFETNPSAGEFQISLPEDLTHSGVQGSIVVRYMVSGPFGTQPPPGSGPPGSGTGDPGGFSGGTVYRPAFVSQLGWGYADDGIDCVAASGCMLLDRTSVGAKTDTPHFLRAAVSPTDFDQGLTFTQIAQAIQDKWGEDTFYSGPISYEQFLRYLNEGRGALCTGNSYALLPYNLEARSEYTGQPFVGPHSLYINEERGDGYLYCYDPAFHVNSKYHITPGFYPPDAVRAYFAAASGSVDRTFALFSRRTGKA